MVFPKIAEIYEVLAFNPDRIVDGGGHGHRCGTCDGRRASIDLRNTSPSRISLSSATGRSFGFDHFPDTYKVARNAWIPPSREPVECGGQLARVRRYWVLGSRRWTKKLLRVMRFAALERFIYYAAEEEYVRSDDKDFAVIADTLHEDIVMKQAPLAALRWRMEGT